MSDTIWMIAEDYEGVDTALGFFVSEYDADEHIKVIQEQDKVLWEKSDLPIHYREINYNTIRIDKHE